MWLNTEINFTEDNTLDFIFGLLNNIYAFVIGILKNAGVSVEGLPEVLIPETK